MNPIALSCHNLHKTFDTADGTVVALDGVSLDIPANSFTALVGPSGCGKSTLLHIIAGLDTAYTGDLSWGIASHRMGYLFQQPRLLPWMDIVHNVAFVLQESGQTRAQMLATAKHYLTLVGLEGFERKYPAQLSGGMQQRVAMARALAVEPEVMIMDEPFGALDELTARRMRAEVIGLFQDTPRTVFFVTHNVTEAAFLADRVLVMSGRPGHIVAELPVNLPRPRDYDDPAVASMAHQIIHHLRMDYETPLAGVPALAES
jgi:ABC-type nitrate/sulfonate/bicarbonate transport system ATPase subunit